MAVKKAPARMKKKTAVKKTAPAKKKAPSKKGGTTLKAKKPAAAKTAKPAASKAQKASKPSPKPAETGSQPQVPPRNQCYVKELGGNSFVIVVERAHNFFDINEMRTLVAICHSAPGEKEAAALMYRWLSEHRSDVLIDSGITNNTDVALLSIYNYLVNHYAVRKD